MTLYPMLGLWDSPVVIIVVAALAALLFGADRLPKLARSAGQAKKEFLAGQAEADAAQEKLREEARLRANRQNEDVSPAAPDKGTPSS